MEIQGQVSVLVDGLFGDDVLPQLLLVIQFVVAAALGGIIGLEREYAQRPAGFRTHMLVSGASALLVGLSGPVVIRASQILDNGGMLNADPIRIVEAVVTGVAFLGAGTIFRSRSGSGIEGLTTAASLLLVSAIGIAVAVGQLVTAVAITVLALVILHVIGSLERRSMNDGRAAAHSPDQHGRESG